MAQRPAQRLRRSRTERMLGGVCGGLAEYFDVDPVLMRLVFVAGTLLTGGIGVPLYIVLWIIMPSEEQLSAPRPERWRQNAEEIVGEARRFGSEVHQTVTARSASSESTASALEQETLEMPASGERGTAGGEVPSIAESELGEPGPGEIYQDARPVQRRRQTWAGIVLVFLGLWLLAHNLRLLWWVRGDLLVPLLLLGAGAWLLYSQVQGRRA